MKNLLLILITIVLFASCQNMGNKQIENNNTKTTVNAKADMLAQELIDETYRTWKAYKQYAWGHDALAPLSKTHKDWYDEPLYISPIDAYSTLHLMGLMEDAKEIENYVVDSLDFNKNIDAKIFEVNIRIY